ncbi:putative type IV pilus biogenesis protein PilC [Actinoplanes missouriensis 431]|uniref:Putative type IV pilus biogenesis protein PilC n=1 Tax=Actinoplanes missouriensis (strain ATCC 14538 / DSM 43046 / CBS 188.64 / JCM 3121 / NBRC 102363 / NCIMB 12654 / NRRL B-3342 / UNCC 431) TaxID=512565 RepID=I0GZD7_ACTM4|nr:type II secretion system F family protein [Actinoplanes missouriensis]BAL86124.1 putative type IV pilus biogenesis protein PilC [Actinoplanes missouriensis 431]
MPATKTFNYNTIDAHGKKSKGTIEAPNEAAATHMLRQRGEVPLGLTLAGQGLQRELKIPGLGNRVKLKDLAVFARQFATMTASGMSLLRSLAILEEQTSSVPLKKAIAEVRADVAGGGALSSSMAKHDRVFPRLMIAMIRAGETGGMIDKALVQIAESLEKDTALRGKIKGALTYPAIVLGFTFVLIAAVLIFIVPIFESMFKSLGGELPAITQFLVTASHNMVWIGPLIIGVGVATSIIYKHQMRTSPEFRFRIDGLKLRMPVFGPLLRKLAMSRFSRNLGLLLNVGVPVMQALSVVGETTGNEVINVAMKDVQAAVRDGQPMSSALRNHKIFPEMVTQMIEVGEESGQISQMLDKVADFYDREVDEAAESLTASIEPIMVLIMGAVVGGMVVCLYLPMFTIYQNIQTS